MSFRMLAGAVIAGTALFASPAFSSPITAQVEFFSYNGGGTFSTLTQASEATYAALNGSSSSAVFSHFTFTYTGDLDWSTSSPTNTVGEFILGAGGTISGLTPGDQAALLATNMSISGDSRTAFFRLTGTISSSGPFSGTITHDDGVTFMVGGNTLINSPGETPSDTDPFSTGAFGPSPFIIDYVEGNGAPSILNLSIAAVPEPATWAMMILGFFGLSFLAYRRKIEAIA
jgi:hypothetical protein